MSLAPEFVAMLRCPRSGGPLVLVPAHADAPACLVCPTARLRYRIDDEVPVLLVDQAEELTEADLKALLVAQDEEP